MWGVTGGGVVEVVREGEGVKKNLLVFSSTKTSTSSDNGSGGFSWPRHSSQASPS